MQTYAGGGVAIVRLAIYDPVNDICGGIMRTRTIITLCAFFALAACTAETENAEGDGEVSTDVEATGEAEPA